MLTLAEGVANLACVGATAVAVVNCLNFGNPEHPEVMWQLSECIDGMAEACRALSLPVIGGNVSLYNESGGADIDPTPVLGVLGLVDVLVGPAAGIGLGGGRHPGAARRPRRGRRLVPPGRFALGHRAPGSIAAGRCRLSICERHAAVCAFVAGLVGAIVSGEPEPPLLSAVHDVSSGGLAVALAEMAVAAGTRLRGGARRSGRALHRAALALRRGHRHARRAVRPGREPGHPGVRPGPGRRGPGRWRATCSTSPSRPCAQAHEGNLAPAVGGVMRVRRLCENGRTVKEACGVFGVYAPGRKVANLTFDGLFALQHRGQESAGMAVSDGDTVTVVKDMGLVATVFDERTLSGLQGHLAIGHTRYSTHGASDWDGAQPVYRPVGRAGFALGHNGNLTNTTELAEKVGMFPGSIVSDSDVVAELLAHAFPETGELAAALQAVLPIVEGAFSFVLMNTQKLFGVRDPYGFRPLCLGRLGPAEAPGGLGAGLGDARPQRHRRHLRARDRPRASWW